MERGWLWRRTLQSGQVGETMQKGLSGQRLVTLFLAGMVLFNFPLLSLFDRAAPTLGGVPLLYVYVFLVWAILVGGMALMIERGGR